MHVKIEVFFPFQYSTTNNNQPPNKSPNQDPLATVIDRNDNQPSFVSENVKNQSVSDGSQSHTVANGSGNQEFTAEDVRELMFHIQWLQSQLSQVKAQLSFFCKIGSI